jgi:hypothetical protein
LSFSRARHRSFSQGTTTSSHRWGASNEDSAQRGKNVSDTVHPFINNYWLTSFTSLL